MKRKKQNDRRSKPEGQIRTARERIQILLDEAVKSHKENPELSKRYFQLSKKIGMRFNVRMPVNLKRRFCKECFSYIAEGWRFKQGRMYARCRNCNCIMRYPYKQAKNGRSGERANT